MRRIIKGRKSGWAYTQLGQGEADIVKHPGPDLISVGWGGTFTDRK